MNGGGDAAGFLDGIKHVPQRQALVIPLPPAEGSSFDACMMPLTADFLDSMPECVAQMNEWRVRNPLYSLARFPLSFERTAQWAKKAIIEAPDRILFFIYGPNGERIGHVGLRDMRVEPPCSCFVNSVMRGIDGLYPGIMGRALDALCSWARDSFGFSAFHLDVVSTNAHAIAFYERHGFRHCADIPLTRVVVNGEESYRLAPADCEPDAMYKRMVKTL